jgi:hypothetical protein
MTNQPELESRITHALEQQPETLIPAGFATRVLAALPAQSPAKPRLQAGRTIAIISAVALTITTFAIAPHAAPSFASLTFDVELLLLAQLGAIAYYLTRSPQSRRLF